MDSLGDFDDADSRVSLPSFTASNARGLTGANRQEALGADRPLVVHEGNRPHLEPGFPDQPEPRGTREQPAHVLVVFNVDRYA
jgi:hypothetical protein